MGGGFTFCTEYGKRFSHKNNFGGQKGNMDKSGRKDFNGWIKLKTKLHYLGHPMDISEGDVWWCATGENIQTEINGKSGRFSRPILVL